MKYRIELAASAKADIHSQICWLREGNSPVAASTWLDGLYKAIYDRHIACEEPEP
jgi:hypothetical protein